MKRHFYYLQSHYTNTIHKLMNDLVSDTHARANPLQTITTLLHTKYQHLEHWPDDPLLSPKHPHTNDNTGERQHRLHMDLCLHVMYTALLSYVESAVGRGDLHVVCFAVLLMVVLWREGGQFSLRQDRFEWLWRNICIGDDGGNGSEYERLCGVGARFLQERQAIVPIIWSRATDDLDPSNGLPAIATTSSIASLFDSRVRVLENRKVLRKFTDDLAKKASAPPTTILKSLPAVTALLEDYAKLKAKALNKAKFSKKSRLWKSGLQLIRENFGAQLTEILEGVSPGCTSGNGGRQVEVPLSSGDESEEENVVMAPSPKRAKSYSSSSSSSSGRSVTPFLEAGDMPSIM